MNKILSSFNLFRLRRKTSLRNDMQDVLMAKYYAFTSPTGGFGDFEHETTPAATRHLHYIQGGDRLAAVKRKNNFHLKFLIHFNEY